MAHRALQLLANEPAQRLNRGAGSGVAAEDRRNDSSLYSPLRWPEVPAERLRRGATDGRRIAMASVSVSIGVAVLTFGVGLLGLYLKRLVPERHMCAGSRDMIGAVIGLLSLLLALVLGTLVGSAYGFFGFCCKLRC